MADQTKSTSSPESGDAGTDGGATPQSETNWQVFTSALPGLTVIAFLIVLLITVAFVWNWSSKNPQGSLTIAGAIQSKKSSNEDKSSQKDETVITGRVLDNGVSASDATVWMIVTDELGNQYAPVVSNTNSQGEFSSAPIPIALAVDHGTSSKVVIQAKVVHQGGYFTGIEKSGELVIERNSGVKVWRVQEAGGYLVLLTVFFGMSIIIAFCTRWLRNRFFYYASLLCAFVFTFFMLFLIAGAESALSANARQDESISLGVAYVFKGTYVRGMIPEQLISLTAPSLKKTIPISNDPNSNTTSPLPRAQGGGLDVVEEPLVRGFGAPLWVILLSVLGAALFTVALIVKEIQEEEPQGSAFVVRTKTLVEHQFFILFSPLGGVFVFQFLLAAGAATEPVTVAIAALGSGVVLNLLLALALTRAQGVLSTNSNPPNVQNGGTRST